MCIAIGPLQETRRNLFGRLWWHIASTPTRLLGFAALLHSLLMTGAYLNGVYDAKALPLAVLVIGGLALFALLMHHFPRWSDRSQLHYMRYTAIFTLASLALLPYETGLAYSSEWLSIALGGLALLLGLQGLHGYCGWMKGNHRQKARQWMAMTYLALLLGLGLNFFAAYGM